MDHLWVERRGTLTVVHLGVEYSALDMDQLKDLQAFLLRLAEEKEKPRLLFDLGNTDYFGSGFINVLVQCYRSIGKRRGQFALCQVSSNLVAELKACRLHELWPVYKSHEQAIERMQEFSG